MIIFILRFEGCFILDRIKREMATPSQQTNDEYALEQKRGFFPSLKLVGGGKFVKAKKS